MLVSSEALDFRRHNSPRSEGEYGATGIFAVGLCDCQMNMNKKMVEEKAIKVMKYMTKQELKARKMAF